MRKVPPKRCIPRSLAFDGYRDGCVHRTYVAFLGEGSTSLYFPGEEALERGGKGRVCACFAPWTGFFKGKKTVTGYGRRAYTPLRGLPSNLPITNYFYGAVAGCVETEGKQHLGRGERRLEGPW